MILLDTSGIIAAYNRREPEHHAVRSLLAGASEPLVVTPLVLAEVDYLATKYLGPNGARTVLAELDQLASVTSFSSEDLRAAIQLLDRYSDLRIGLTDAANVVTAGRYRTATVLSLDNHYRVVQPPSGTRLTVLPG